ncbi:DUF305 domain-containing protein [Micromonospora sp. NPDC047670]|uniref:DUF305 domain-containing protein n=1 Tax=Micromonospora sp. NPDC047670 TaxID=3364252 RepID=UPI00371FB481
MSTPTTIEASELDGPAPEQRRPSGRRWGTAALALAVVVGLLLGYAGGLLTPRLTRPGDASVEAGFARDMMTHHAQAVEIGMIAFDKGTDPEVRSIGGDIAAAQQGEIGTMQTWLRSWGLDPTGSQPAMSWMSDGAGLVKDGLMPGMATPEEMAKLRAAEGRELDTLFLRMMIKHHLGGIHMIDGVLDASDEADVVRTAQTMKNTQRNDLTNLQNALERLGG